jgi:hypothetical protein
MARLLFKVVRISAGLALIALFLHTANLAVRDCTAGLYTYDNCLWLWVGEKLGLLQSRLARAVVFEVVGLTLLAGIYLTARYVFPHRSSRLSSVRRPGEDGLNRSDSTRESTTSR